MCDPRVFGALLFRCMVAGLCWHFSNLPWLCKVFLQTFLHFASQFRNLKAISMLGGDFAAISKFGDHFTAISKLGDHFIAISQLESECTGLPNGTRVPKSGFATVKYSSKWSFGCEIGIFHVLGFRSCEMRFTVLRNGTHVPKCASQPRNTLRNGALTAKLRIFTLWSFAAISQLRNEGHCAAEWHSCAKSAFAAAKSSAEWDFGCQKK